MLTLLAFLAGAAVVAACAYPVWRRQADDLRVTHDRLYTAWQQGAVIAPAPDAEPPEELAPIPDALQEYVTEWSSPEVRAKVEDRIRRMQARGMSVGDIGKAFLLERQTQLF